MKQAQVQAWGEAPKYVDVPNPPPPAEGQVQVKVLAAGLHQLVRGRASGKHYSASVLPHIPGADGVGRTIPGDELVYFSAITPQGGSFTEIINLPASTVSPLPSNVDATQAAGLMNAVMASWMAIKARTKDLPPNFTVLILGASGFSGSVAVSVARTLGATKVVGAARNISKLQDSGLDATIKLEDDATKTDFSAALDADLILDFIFGPQVVALFKALSNKKPVQFVQIGTIGAPTVDFPGDILRSKDITIRGTGPGSWRMPQFFAEVPKIAAAIANGKIKPADLRVAKLVDIESVWTEKESRRIVVNP